MTRTEKQNEIIDDVIFKCNSNAYLEACTGFGKTRIFLNLIKKLILLYNIKNIHIVVPTIDLLEQTIKKVNEFGYKEENVKVFVINSYIKTNHNVDLLIADECHLYTSESAKHFNLLIERTFYKYCFFVSGTLEEQHRNFLLKNNIKCVAVITRKEAIQNNWISNYTSYVLMLKLNEIDELEHQKLNKKIRGAFTYFNDRNSFNLILKCVSDKLFRQQIALQKNITEGQLFVICKNALDAISKRKTILQDCDTKKDIILEIVSKLPYKGLIFGQSTNFSDKIADLINIQNNKEICLSVHSKKKSIENKSAIKKLTDNRYNISLISSAKKLTTGIDIPDLQLGILASYISSSIIASQIFGRILRLDNRKEKALLITLCIKDSQEETWLNKNGIMKESIIVNSIDEIIENEKNINNIITLL